MIQNHTLSSKHVISCCIRLSNGRLASVDVNNTITIRNINDGNIEGVVQIPDTTGRQSHCLMVEASPNILALYDSDTLRFWKVDIELKRTEIQMEYPSGSKCRTMLAMKDSVVLPLLLLDESRLQNYHMYIWKPQLEPKPIEGIQLIGHFRKDSHLIRLSDDKCAIGDSEGYVTIIDTHSTVAVSERITDQKIEGIDRFDDNALLITGIEAYGYSVKKWNYVTNEVTLLTDWEQMGQPPFVDGIKKLNDTTYLIWHTGMVIIDTTGNNPPLSMNKVFKDQYGEGISGRVKQVAVNGETVAFATDKKTLCTFNLSKGFLTKLETDAEVINLGFNGDTLIYLTKNGELYQMSHNSDSPQLLASRIRHFTVEDGILAWGSDSIFVSVNG